MVLLPKRDLRIPLLGPDLQIWFELKRVFLVLRFLVDWGFLWLKSFVGLIVLLRSNRLLKQFFRKVFLSRLTTKNELAIVVVVAILIRVICEVWITQRWLQNWCCH